MAAIPRTLPPLVLPSTGSTRREIFTTEQRIFLLKRHMKVTGHAFWCDLQEYFRLTGKSFGSKRISHLHFEGSSISDQKLLSIMQRFPHAMSICLQNCRLITDHSICSLMRTHLYLQQMHLAGTSITGRSVIAMSLQGFHLREVDLSHCRVSREALALLQNACPRLRSVTSTDHLSLSHPSHSSTYSVSSELDPPISFLQLEERAISLRDRMERTQRASLQDLEEYQNTMRIHFCSSRILSIDLSDSAVRDDELLQILRNFPNLQNVSLKDCPLLTDRGIRHLTQALFLRTINLVNCRGASPQIILYLAENCSRLEALDLSGRSVSTADIHSIKRLCPRIQILILDDCRGVDREEILRTYPRLRISNAPTPTLPYLHRITRILAERTWPLAMRNGTGQRFLVSIPSVHRRHHSSLS